jgi:hypothetical protein
MATNTNNIIEAINAVRINTSIFYRRLDTTAYTAVPKGQRHARTKRTSGGAG